MALIIDSNIVKGYYLEVVSELPHELTASPKPLFEQLEQTIYVDSGGQIENEWRGVVQPEWFEAWYAGLLASGAVELVDVQSEPVLRKALKALGFPVSGRDFWYVRTAKAAAGKHGNASLVAEDLDFFDPKQKSATGAKRRKILCSKNSPVAKLLRDTEIINVYCVHTFLFGY